MRYPSAAIICLMISFFHVTLLSGQSRECLTMGFDSIRRANTPGIGSLTDLENWLAGNKTYNARIETKVYRIPVVVHVIHNGEQVGFGPNISYEQVLSQIEVLNEDFGREFGTNGFNDDPLGVDTGIEFYLAKYDPDGNLLDEPGIDRIDGGQDSWSIRIFQNQIENELKPETIWDPERYFNIWTVNFGGFVGRALLGYAQFPDMSGLNGLDENEGSALTDGVVVGYRYFGSSEKGNFPDLSAPYDLGRTTTHEVGHWLGLRHIWGDGDCSFDDYVEDTPLAAEATEGCPETLFSCGVESMIENYMDYTNDRCMNIFTAGQLDRMIMVLENSPRRVELVDPVLGFNSINTQLSVYPNPATKEIFIELDASAPLEFTVIDATGQEIMSQQQNDPIKQRQKVIIEALEPGTYLLLVKYLNAGTETIRFIKTQ